MNHRQHRALMEQKRFMANLQGCPVARAIRRDREKTEAQRAAEEFRDQLLTTRISMLSAQDGEDATELLAKLSVVIGTPCEAGARIFKDQQPPWVRQLHGALRTIHAMCMQGYRWQSQFALALDRALEIAGEDRPELDPGTFTSAWLEANGLAGSILAHSVDAEAIAA